MPVTLTSPANSSTAGPGSGRADGPRSSLLRARQIKPVTQPGTLHFHRRLSQLGGVP